MYVQRCMIYYLVFGWSPVCEINMTLRVEVQVKHKLKMTVFFKPPMDNVLNQCTRPLFEGSEKNILINNGDSFELNCVCLCNKRNMYYMSLRNVYIAVLSD